MTELGQNIAEHEDIARKCKVIWYKVKDYQNAFTAIEEVFYSLYENYKAYKDYQKFY